MDNKLLEMINILRNKKYRIFSILVVVILIIFYFKLTSKNIPESIPVIITPTPIPTINIIPTSPPSENQEQGDPNFHENIQDKTEELYPLFGKIPYRTEKYTVDYLTVLTLEVVLKQDTPKIRQEVLDWITSKGVDPKSHTILWKTQ